METGKGNVIWTINVTGPDFKSHALDISGCRIAKFHWTLSKGNQNV
jgi:hypothetical protein